MRQRRALLRRASCASSGLTDKREIRVETAGGVIVPTLEDDGEVTRRHGRAALRAAATFRSSAERGARRPSRSTSTARASTIAALSMGNPHAVQVVADVDARAGRDRRAR